MRDTPSSAVPCDGCTLCCQGDAIRILPEDDASKYATVPHAWIAGALMLDHDKDGDCVYLGYINAMQRGCTIQDTKPQMCREMDCRAIAAGVSWTKARKLNIVRVWRRGKELNKEAA